MRATTADRAQSSTNPYLIVAMAWAIPGAGHLWLGRWQKGAIFCVTLLLMFVFGLWIEGRLVPLIPLDLTQPLVVLMALADIGNGVPYFIAKAVGAGEGRVVAITYEYGNTFLIVAGLLNLLVALDAFDVAKGRK
jgi:hypothetical protein